MKISNQCICAVEAMADMLVEGRDRPRTTQAIARRIGRSVSYIEQILAKLRDAGLVKGERGPGGGYTLRQPAHRIAIADIVRAVEPRAVGSAIDTATAWVDGPDLLWDAVENCTLTFLSGVSLAEAVPAPSVVKLGGIHAMRRPSVHSAS